MTADSRPIQVFYSYGHEDEALRKTLETGSAAPKLLESKRDG